METGLGAEVVGGLSTGAGVTVEAGDAVAIVSVELCSALPGGGASSGNLPVPGGGCGPSFGLLFSRLSLVRAPGPRVGDGGPDRFRERGERGLELPDDSLETEQLRGLAPFSAAGVAVSFFGTNMTDTQLSSESRLVSLWKLFSLELSELSSREVRLSREE